MSVVDDAVCAEASGIVLVDSFLALYRTYDLFFVLQQPAASKKGDVDSADHLLDDTLREIYNDIIREVVPSVEKDHGDQAAAAPKVL
jgi:hypothetical protein